MTTAQPSPHPEAVWISWQRHRRTQEIAPALGAELHELVSHLGRPWKYLPLIFGTTALLVRRHPRVVIVQCPSVFLGCLVALLKPWLGYILILDLHNEAVRPFLNDSRSYRRLLRWIWRSADFNIVTNENLSRDIEAAGARPFVLADRVPAGMRAATISARSPVRQVVFICTFQADEPYREVIIAGGQLPENVVLHVTGKHESVADLPPLPRNVRLTGFLPQREYDDLLHQADAIMDLTAMDDCLVCGAYEAVAVGKPLITSDTAALRGYFSKGTVYTAHTSDAIANAVTRALDDAGRLASEMVTLRHELDRDWVQRCQQLCDQLSLKPVAADDPWPEHRLAR